MHLAVCAICSSNSLPRLSFFLIFQNITQSETERSSAQGFYFPLLYNSMKKTTFRIRLQRTDKVSVAVDRKRKHFGWLLGLVVDVLFQMS